MVLSDNKPRHMLIYNSLYITCIGVAPLQTEENHLSKKLGVTISLQVCMRIHLVMGMIFDTA